MPHEVRLQADGKYLVVSDSTEARVAGPFFSYEVAQSCAIMLDRFEEVIAAINEINDQLRAMQERQNLGK